MPEGSVHGQSGSVNCGAVAPLRTIGDLMQSEASRLLAWAEEAMKKHPTTLEMPYEVSMAALGLRQAIDDWTEARCAENRS